MGKNKGMGGKNRKKGKKQEELVDNAKRELEFRHVGEEYAQILRVLGDHRYEAMCMDGTLRICQVRGNLRKKVCVQANDIVLVALMDFQAGEKGDKAGIIWRYQRDEVRQLITHGELPDNLKLDGDLDGDASFDNMVDFADDVDDIDNI